MKIRVYDYHVSIILFFSFFLWGRRTEVFLICALVEKIFCYFNCVIAIIILLFVIYTRNRCIENSYYKIFCKLRTNVFRTSSRVFESFEFLNFLFPVIRFDFLFLFFFFYVLSLSSVVLARRFSRTLRRETLRAPSWPLVGATRFRVLYFDPSPVLLSDFRDLECCLSNDVHVKLIVGAYSSFSYHLRPQNLLSSASELRWTVAGDV